MRVPPGGCDILVGMSLRDNLPLYLYELHEGDEDVFTDLLLAHGACAEDTLDP